MYNRHISLSPSQLFVSGVTFIIHLYTKDKVFSYSKFNCAYMLLFLTAVLTLAGFEKGCLMDKMYVFAIDCILIIIINI